MKIQSTTIYHLPITNYHGASGTISTSVVSALQIHLFMQNKPKFQKSQMYVCPVITKDYEKKTLGQRGKKQSQTNPNKAKFQKAKMNVTSIITKGYENKPPIRAPKKQSQTSKRQKTMQTSLPQRIMKKTALSASGKTNPTCRGVASREAGSNPISRPCPEERLAGSSNCFYIKNLFCQWLRHSVILVHYGFLTI